MRPTSQCINLARRSLLLYNTQSRGAFCPRQFSHKPPRLILKSLRTSPRPQLPFLSPSGSYASNVQLSRLFSISADDRKFIKNTAKDSVKWFFIFGFLLTSFGVASVAILTETQERRFPSPHEWSFVTRFHFRRGKWWVLPENCRRIGEDWSGVVREMTVALERLEDADLDGAGLVEQDQEEGGLQVPGVGKAGYDLTAKSDEWRQGYWEVLMGLAKAAENVEGWITVNMPYSDWDMHPPYESWPAQYIPSPSNPNPPDVPPTRAPLPPEELRKPVAPPPETFYMKILTSNGFTTSQRVKAAIGYADWLSFKKLPDSAEEMYRWALDIAISGLSTADPSSVIDPKHAILSSTAPQEHITPNVIFAATELATFHAQQGNATAALPILVSLLRARLNAPEAPETIPPPQGDTSMVAKFLDLLIEPTYPPVPPTGNETFRRVDTDRCDEAALKNYIGELLFVTSPPSSRVMPSQTKVPAGLSWVRDSVSTAKQAQSIPGIVADAAQRKKCETCEEVGLESWGKIMTYLTAQAQEDLDGVRRGWGPRALWWKAVRGTEELENRVEDLQEEEEGVTMRLGKLRNRMLIEERAETDKKFARRFVF